MTAQETPRPWATVTDSLGVAWALRITMAQAMALRTHRQVDLLASDAGRTAVQIADDPIKLCEVAFDVASKQRSELSVVEESDFLNRFDGDSWHELFEATVEAIIDFFPPARRAPLIAVWKRRRATIDRAQQEVIQTIEKPETLDALDREADKAVADFRQRISDAGTIQS